MRMPVVVRAKAREGTVAIVDVAAHIQIATHTNGAVVLKLDEAAGAMHEPKLPDRGGGGQLGDAKGGTDNHPMLGVALLRQHHDLIARRRRANETPTGPSPRG